MTTAIALTIAGSDPSGGAGIQADLKTFSALGVYGAAAITALTVQNTRGVTAVEIVPPQLIAAQIDAVCGDLAVGAVKIGMLGNAPAIEAIADALDRHAQKNVVLDPVMMSGTGESLLAQDVLDVLRRVLIPRALLLTPNLAEAAALLDAPPAGSESDMRAQAAWLLGLGARAVLIKGGHAGGAESVDFLIDGAIELRLPATRIAAKSLHGTGCTLSAAIAAGLAKGFPLAEAVGQAKAYVTAAIAAADRLAIGSGRSPLHHFHAWW